MSKVAGEATARSFQARTGAHVYDLRINNVIEPHEYAEMFPAFLENPSLRRRNVFAYIDTRDLAQMVQRCLDTDGLGYQVFNVANADMSVAATTREIRNRFYDGVEVRREMSRDETFYAIDKARDLLGYAPQHSWREVLPDPGTGPPEVRQCQFRRYAVGRGPRRHEGQGLAPAACPSPAIRRGRVTCLVLSGALLRRKCARFVRRGGRTREPRP